jgi:hypothetical protein
MNAARKKESKMNRNSPAAAIAFASLLIAATIGIPPSLHADQVKPAWQITFDRLVHALQTDDRTDDRTEFLTNATDDMNQAMTQPLLNKVSSDLKPHLEKGFNATYLCELKQKGFTVNLWKVTFKDGSDDCIFRIVMQEDQLAGFFLQ